MKTVSIDLDGVLAEPRFFPLLWHSTGRVLHHLFLVSVWFSSIHGYIQTKKNISHNGKKGLELLRAHNFKLIINSGRSAQVYAATKQWLHKEGIDSMIADMYLWGTSDTKAPTKSQGIATTQSAYHIDDDPRVISELATTSSIETLILISQRRKDRNRYAHSARIVVQPNLFKAAEYIIHHS